MAQILNRSPNSTVGVKASRSSTSSTEEWFDALQNNSPLSSSSDGAFSRAHYYPLVSPNFVPSARPRGDAFTAYPQSSGSPFIGFPKPVSTTNRNASSSSTTRRKLQSPSRAPGPIGNSPARSSHNNNGPGPIRLPRQASTSNGNTVSPFNTTDLSLRYPPPPDITPQPPKPTTGPGLQSGSPAGSAISQPPRLALPQPALGLPSLFPRPKSPQTTDPPTGLAAWKGYFGEPQCQDPARRCQEVRKLLEIRTKKLRRALASEDKVFTRGREIIANWEHTIRLLDTRDTQLGAANRELQARNADVAQGEKEIKRLNSLVERLTAEKEDVEKKEWVVRSLLERERQQRRLQNGAGGPPRLPFQSVRMQTEAQLEAQSQTLISCEVCIHSMCKGKVEDEESEEEDENQDAKDEEEDKGEDQDKDENEDEEEEEYYDENQYQEEHQYQEADDRYHELEHQCQEVEARYQEEETQYLELEHQDQEAEDDWVVNGYDGDEEYESEASSSA